VRRSALAYQQQAIATERLIDGLNRQEVCVRYQGKVMLLARRLAERLPPDCQVELGDLISYGAIGLLEAFERFDDSREIQFSTYAEYRIRGAMLDALRSNDTFSRRRRQLSRRIESAAQELRRELGREPEPVEVAQQLGIDLDDYWSAMERVSPISVVSLDSGAGDDDESRTLLEQIENESAVRPDLDLGAVDLRRVLREAIAGLPERERHCVLMYYGKELSLAEIAEVYGVTASRISQVLTGARGRLRKRLSDDVELSDLEALR
jgi:RNA polymerase sigma factor for flagellar operon FliA